MNMLDEITVVEARQIIREALLRDGLDEVFLSKILTVVHEHYGEDDAGNSARAAKAILKSLFDY